MPCNLALFRITDGTFTVNLLDEAGFSITSWLPAVPGFKEGGVWGNSPFVDSAYPVFGVYDNTTEEMDLILTASSTNSVAYKLQNLRRLLRQASVFWFGRQGHVWVEARFHGETSTRYAVLTAGTLATDAQAIGGGTVQPSGNIVMQSLHLQLTRLHWTANLPGVGTDTALISEMVYNGFVFGTVDEDEVTEPTTAGVYLSNKQNMANLTNVHNGTAGGNLIGASLSFTLFNGGTTVLFGISAAVTNSGPFASLVFDIATAAEGAPTLVWEYLSAAGPTWTAFTPLNDTTAGFTVAGIGSVHWEQPAFSTGTSPGGGLPAGFWVRVRISAGAFTTEPTQQNRNIYTVTLPYLDIATDTVKGDIPALAALTISTPVPGAIDYITHRVIGGIRTIEDDERFAPIINLADEQNQTGITVTAGGGFSARQNAATGRGVQTSVAAGVTSTGVTFVIDSSLLSAYEGQYRVFVKLENTAGTSSISTYIRFRHLTSAGAGLSEFLTREEPLEAEQDIRIIDLGLLSIPLDGNRHRYSSRSLGNLSGEVFIHNAHASSTATINHYEVILIPVDEWSFDTQSSLSFVTAAMDDDDTLLIDNIDSNIPSTTLSDDDGSEKVVWQLISNGQVRLNAGRKQRLCLISEHVFNTSEAAHSRAPAMLKVSIQNQAQYFSLIGEGL